MRIYDFSVYECEGCGKPYTMDDYDTSTIEPQDNDRCPKCTLEQMNLDKANGIE